MGTVPFQRDLLAWYATHKRDLPWRGSKDPYRIWLSEVILQQTRVAQGMPYFHAFVSNYPTVRHLADAPIEDVLRTWQGLGYYSRARNMHQTAQYIAYTLGGVFPTSFNELRKLKGVGDYTAAAIASLAYEEKVAVVDGNVYRVLARLFGIELDILSSKGKSYFSELAQSLLPDSPPSIYNQAMMEFGALQCVPKQPHCGICPLQWCCEAHKQGKQALLPVKKKKQASKTRYFYYFVLEHAGSVLLKPRTGSDIWNGLYDFPLHESLEPMEDEVIFSTLSSLLGNTNAEITGISKTYTHILTHQKLLVKFVAAKVDVPISLPMGQWADAATLHALPKPILIANYLEERSRHALQGVLWNDKS